MVNNRMDQDYNYLLKRGVLTSKTSPVHAQNAVGIHKKAPLATFLTNEGELMSQAVIDHIHWKRNLIS